MKKIRKIVLGVVIATMMSSVVVFASVNGSKSLKTGTVYGSLAGSNGYANAGTSFSPGAGYSNEKAYVFIESVHANGTQLDKNYAYGTNNDKYNAWTYLRDTRAVTWHSAHSSSGTDNSLWLWIED